MLDPFFVYFNIIQNINPLGFILKIEGNVIGIAEFMSRVIFLINDFVVMNLTLVIEAAIPDES